MPGIVDRLATPERAAVVPDDPPVLPELDPIGIGAEFDGDARRRWLRPSTCCTRQVFDGEAGMAWNPSKGPTYGTRLGRSASSICQIVRSRTSGCGCALAQAMQRSISQAFNSS